MSGPPIAFRPAREDDEPFIYKSWLKTYYEGSAFASEMLPSVFYDNHNAVIKGLLAQAETVVCCNPEDDLQIFGFACFSMINGVPIIHWIHVKSTYRGFGIGKSLFQLIEGRRPKKELPIVISHVTRELHRRGMKKFVYNPYVISQIIGGI